MKIIFFFLFIILNNVVYGAQRTISLIRDTEIENFLKAISNPIFKSANLNENDVEFYIVNDTSINAFVSGGQKIFVNTGTLTTFETPDAVLGIIAHEIGHISAGHLARAGEDIGNLKNISIGSILLGIGSMLAGAPELGQAIIFGGMQIQQQNMLAYTRIQEEAADNLAINYLHDNQLSSSALMKSMEKFYLNELQYSNIMEYYSTHPLSRNRKQFVENKMKKEKYTNDNFNENLKNSFNFIKAKILAYNNNFTNFIFEIDKNSDYYQYAKAITNMRKNNLKQALSDIEKLILKYPNNPYFYELKGDIYFRKNLIEKALKNYSIANKMLKNNTLIKETFAFIVIKYKKEELYLQAIENLNFVIQNDNRPTMSLKLLAEIYYNMNNFAKSYLNLAKYYLNINNPLKATEYLNLATKNTTDKKVLNSIEDLKKTM